MEPVTIDIVLNENVTGKAEDIGDALQKITADVIVSRKETQQNIIMQRAYLEQLEQEISALQRKHAALSSRREKTPAEVTERNKIAKSINELQRTLADEKEGLAELERESKRLNDAWKQLNTSAASIKSEMIALEKAGMRHTDQYRSLEAQLRSTTEAQGELNKQQQLIRNNSASFAAIIEGLQGLAGVVTATAGALSLVGSESEEYAMIQTKLQSLIAITVGLQQAHSLASSTSAFRLQFTSKATELYSAAILRLASAMKINTTAARLWVGVLTGGLSVAIMLAISSIDKLITKQREQRAEEARISKSVATSIAEQVTLIHKLAREYQALGDNVSAKNKFLTDHYEELDKTGYAIRDITSADKIFISQTDTFVAALTERAKASALMEVAAAKYKQSIEKMLRGEQERMTTRWYDWSLRDTDGAMAKRLAERRGNAIITAAKNEMATISQTLSSIYTHEIDADKITAALGVDTIAEEQRKRDAISKSVESHERADRLAAEHRAVITKLSEISLSAQRDQDALLIAAMQEGTQKQLAQLQHDHVQKQILIKKQLSEITELESKHNVDGSKQRNALTTLSDTQEQAYATQVERIRSAERQAIQRIVSEATANSGSRQEAEITALTDHYDQMLDKIKEYNHDLIAQEEARLSIVEQRNRAILLKRREQALEQANFEAEIAARAAEIRVTYYSSDADRDEEILSTQLDSARKRLVLLEQIGEAGGDSIRDIELLCTEIERLNNELAHVPVKRMREMASNIKGALSVLSELGGNIGKLFSNLESSVDSIISSLDADTSTATRLTAAARSLVSIYNMITDTLTDNAEAERKWADAAEEATHRARIAHLKVLEHVDSNIFGVRNPYAQAIAGAEKYRTAMTMLGETLKQVATGRIQVGTKEVTDWGNIGKGVGAGASAGAAIGAAVGSIIPGIGNMIGGAIGGLIGSIFGGVTGAVKKKVVPIMASISDEFGSILKEGTKTFELNPQILENYHKLDEATKKIVDNWEAIRTEALKAEEEMISTIQRLAGDLGATLSNSLAEAFRSGDITSALDDFDAQVTKVIENILQQMIFAHYFEETFKQLSQRMKSSFDVDGDMTLVDDLAWISSEVRQHIQGYAEAMKQAQVAMKEQGFELYKSDNQERTSAARRGLAQASQDSIDELHGIATNILMQVRILAELSTVTASTNKERDSILRAQLMQLEIIAENSRYLRHLKELHEDSAAMRRDGIILKK